MRQRTPWLLLLGLVALLRLPYPWFPVQGDDAFYLAMAQHALVDPAHPNHFKLIAQGTEVDMRGFPKPPGNAWILASVISLSGGEIYEPVLHAVYAGFSLLALWSVWELGLVLCALPEWGVLVFAAVPAFVINGNSLEADLPFVAFFLAALAFFVRAIEDESRAALVLSAIAASIAALIEYKTIALVPIAALYLWRGKRRGWLTAWAVALTPAVAFAAWQLFERFSTGAAGAEVLAGYFQSRGLQSGANKLRNAIALTVHLGWMVSPILTAAAFGRFEWIVAAVAGLGGAVWMQDASPLFWLPFALGAALILRSVRGAVTGFLEAWLVGFYLFSLIVFFAGSARYLLPAAAPLAFITLNLWHRASRPRSWLAAGVALQMLLSLALNHANFEQWRAYRDAVAQWQGQLGAQRSWVAADMGLRFYSESAGAAPLRRGQAVRPGDLVISSLMSRDIDYTTGGGAAVPLGKAEVRPSLPLRLFAWKSKSAYSFHAGGLRAFDIDSGLADEVIAVHIVERPPVLSFLPMNAPEAAFQLGSGAYAVEDNSWRWTSKRVTVLLKRPPNPAPVEARFRIIDASPVRHARLIVDGEVAAEATYPGPGLYTLRTSKPISAPLDQVVATLSFDRSFQTPNDARELSVILTGIGFRSE